MESTEHSAYDYYSFSNFLFLSVFILAVLGPHCGSGDLHWGMQTS